MSAGRTFVAVLVVACEPRHDFLPVRILCSLYFGDEVFRVVATKGGRQLVKMKDLDLAALLAPICKPFRSAHEVFSRKCLSEHQIEQLADSAALPGLHATPDLQGEPR